MQARSSFAVVVILSIACVASSFTYAQQATRADPRAAIDELLKERRDILAKRVDVLDEQHAAGAATLNAVLTARDQLWDAELQLVKAKEQRVALYRKRLDNMRELENTVKRQFDAGQCPLEATLSATAARLQAEIDLLREQL